MRAPRPALPLAQLPRVCQLCRAMNFHRQRKSDQSLGGGPAPLIGEGEFFFGLGFVGLGEFGVGLHAEATGVVAEFVDGFFGDF
jgi:hypothetical protein